MSFLITSPNLDNLLTDYQCNIPIVTEQQDEYMSSWLFKNDRTNMIEYMNNHNYSKICISSISSTSCECKNKNLNNEIGVWLTLDLVDQTHINIILGIIDIISNTRYDKIYEISLFDNKKSSDPDYYSYDIVAIKLEYYKKYVMVNLNVHRGTDIEK